MLNHLLMIIVYLAVFFVAQRQLNKWIHLQAEKKQVSEVRSRLISRLISYLLFFVTLSIMAVSLGLGYQEVSLFVSSAFAVLGVALFAQWSILSNITAGVLIFFAFPYRIGDRIKIVDKEENMSGIIVEISLFHVLIKRDVGDVMTYPNSLMLQKAVIKLPEPRTANTFSTSNKTKAKINANRAKWLK
ncbi:MAG: mechanosensitive ion channel family protein [Shewanella psychromarinicola]|jgi:small-conductance mechanosensitive channel|uniref:mechanosensitive ion channel family protein n=1 Tax=Shewanella TaxID=22 RepID=UPI000C32A66D|nr:mechanosensitive ion channel family protein [Shewanella sp. Actino-trap-3]PKG78806.1 mechanosensitive ion channel protein MscS [Shewanella sp. Actino-trap-3]